MSVRVGPQQWTIGFHYDVAQHNIISDTTLQWLKQNMNQSVNSQEIPYIRPRRRATEFLWWGFGRKVTFIMALHCIWLSGALVLDFAGVVVQQGRVRKTPCHGNVFHITGPFLKVSTRYWILLMKGQLYRVFVEFWYFFDVSLPKVLKTVELPVI